jgi:hypothetical protein
MPIKSSSICLIRPPELLPTTLDEHDPYYRCMEDVQQRCAGIGWYTVRLEPSPRLLVATASRKKCMDSATRGMGEAECVVLFLESEIKKCHATRCPVSVWFDQMSTVTYTAVKYSGWIEVHVNSKCSLNGKDALHNVLKALADTWRGISSATVTVSSESIVSSLDLRYCLCWSTSHMLSVQLAVLTSSTGNRSRRLV